MTETRYSVAEEPTAPPDDIRRIHDGTGSSDPDDVGPRAFAPLVLTLRDDCGQLVGGLLGATIWGWLSVDALWVARGLRGAGQGSRLLKAAEERARVRGCSRARLDTFDFQALPFYERRGYAVYGHLQDFPPGHTQYHLAKELAGPPTELC